MIGALRKPALAVMTTERLEQIRRRIHELQFIMAARGPADFSVELVAEHRDLVRERNALREGRAS